MAYFMTAGSARSGGNVLPGRKPSYLQQQQQQQQQLPQHQDFADEDDAFEFEHMAALERDMEGFVDGYSTSSRATPLASAAAPHPGSGYAFELSPAAPAFEARGFQAAGGASPPYMQFQPAPRGMQQQQQQQQKQQQQQQGGVNHIHHAAMATAAGGSGMYASKHSADGMMGAAAWKPSAGMGLSSSSSSSSSNTHTPTAAPTVSINNSSNNHNPTGTTAAAGGVGAMPTTKSSGSSLASSLPRAVVEQNNHMDAASFILECKNGDEAGAMDFVRGVFLALCNPVLPGEVISPDAHDWDSAVRGGPPYITPEDQSAAQTQLVMHQRSSLLLQAQRMGVAPRAPPISPVNLLGDDIDQKQSTLVVLVPGRAHIVGHLIGKGGAEVGRIEREISVTIKIESASKMSAQLMERSVCIIGSVASVTLAQQLVSHKVHEKLLSEGVQAEVLKMIVPNEIVRHLIGKNGSNINRLQNESGARIQVEPESTMNPGAMGRTIVLQGAEGCRTFAQYLILRQIAEDRNVHAEWAVRLPGGGGYSSSSTSPNLGPTSPPPQGGVATNTSQTPTSPILSASAPSASIGPSGANGSMVLNNNSHHHHNHHHHNKYAANPLMTSIAQLAGSSSTSNTSGAGSHHHPQPPPQQQQQHPSHHHHHHQNQLPQQHVVVIFVAEPNVPYLMGRNASTIHEIQSQTGARIHVAKPNLGDSHEGRRVTISGSTEAIEAAQQMIHNKLSFLSMNQQQQPLHHQQQQE